MPFIVARRRGRHLAAWLGILLLGSLALVAQAPKLAPTQPQVAYRFLREILQADYARAYRRLAPAVRAGMGPAAFAAAAQPLRRAGQARGTAIELYQVGALLADAQHPTEWFCRFSFARDSARRPPPVLLEVTFRDTAARAVSGFRLSQR